MDRESIFSMVTLVFLFISDFISSFHPFFFFQYFFFLTLMISFLHLMFHSDSFYNFYLFFYAFFLLVRYSYFYYFKIIPEKKKNYLYDYLIELPNVQNIEEECYICLDNYLEKDEDLKYLNCSHIFHPTCLVKWFESESSKEYNCPVCKKNIL